MAYKVTAYKFIRVQKERSTRLYIYIYKASVFHCLLMLLSLSLSLYTHVWLATKDAAVLLFFEVYGLFLHPKYLSIVLFYYIGFKYTKTS